MFKVLIRAPSPGLNRLLREDVLDGNTASPCNVQIRQSVTFQKCFRRGKCLKQERCEICGHSCYSEDNQGDHMHLIHGNIFITIMATILPEILITTNWPQHIYYYKENSQIFLFKWSKTCFCTPGTEKIKGDFIRKQDRVVNRYRNVA